MFLPDCVGSSVEKACGNPSPGMKTPAQAITVVRCIILFTVLSRDIDCTFCITDYIIWNSV